MLPLKVGISIMALGAALEHNIEVKIVPCGISLLLLHFILQFCVEPRILCCRSYIAISSSKHKVSRIGMDTDSEAIV